MPRRPPPLPPSLRPHRDGVLIALAGLVGGLVLWWFDLYNTPTRGREFGAWLLLPLAVTCLTALVRRSAQPWALLVATAALTADIAMGSLLATIVVYTDIVYAAVLYGPKRLSRALLPASVAVTVVVTVGTVTASRNPAALLVGAFCAAVTIAPAWTGAIIRGHRNAAAAERLRAEQTALLAEMDRVQAIGAERARMARELHDVIANHLSAAALHSTAALSLNPPDEAATREALGVIRENSVQGLAEMRRLIGLLRETTDDAAADGAGAGGAVPLATSPTLAGLDALLERARAGAGTAGLRFSLRDDRSADAAALPAPVELAAYRVVQESLTNALKHAAPGTVTVELAHDRPGPLTVRVTSHLPADDAGNDAVAATGPRAPGSGAGLIGMRERAELLGGTLQAGPANGSGTWVVRAELPVEERSSA